MLGTVEHVEPGKIIARLDGRGGDSVSVPTDSYRAIDHGYATTIHKTGATVDRAFVLASSTMDRHLTYVAMTRHRDSVQLYADIKEFASAGRLVDHGVAPYEHNPQSRESYFVTLENDKGERHTVWVLISSGPCEMHRQRSGTGSDCSIKGPRLSRFRMAPVPSAMHGVSSRVTRWRTSS